MMILFWLLCRCIGTFLTGVTMIPILIFGVTGQWKTLFGPFASGFFWDYFFSSYFWSLCKKRRAHCCVCCIRLVGGVEGQFPLASWFTVRKPLVWGTINQTKSSWTPYWSGAWIFAAQQLIAYWAMTSPGHAVVSVHITVRKHNACFQILRASGHWTKYHIKYCIFS